MIAQSFPSEAGIRISMSSASVVEVSTERRRWTPPMSTLSSADRALAERLRTSGCSAPGSACRSSPADRLCSTAADRALLLSQVHRSLQRLGAS